MVNVYVVFLLSVVEWGETIRIHYEDGVWKAGKKNKVQMRGNKRRMGDFLRKGGGMDGASECGKY